jgi:hypothetical protein
MPMTSLSQCRVLDDLVQRGQDTNFNFGAVLCRFTGFTRDWKYVKNHAKYHRIAIFTADDNNARIKYKNLFAFIAWPDNAADVKCNKPKPKGVT